MGDHQTANTVRILLCRAKYVSRAEEPGKRDREALKGGRKEEREREGEGESKRAENRGSRRDDLGEINK